MRTPEEVQAEAQRLMCELGGIRFQRLHGDSREPQIVARLLELDRELGAARTFAAMATTPAPEAGAKETAQ